MKETKNKGDEHVFRTKKNEAMKNKYVSERYDKNKGKFIFE